jgi:metallo-beta-lactamase family protein
MAIALTVLEDSSRGTGACVLLEYEGRRLLLDCGYDDSGPLSLSPSLPVPAASLDAVVLSHGHLGHCGLLPILVRGGFAGKVYSTVATSKIAMLSMLETALLQEEERQWRVSKGQSQLGKGPAYTQEEVTACEPFFAPCEFGEPVSVDEHVTLEFFRAGHGPGSAFVKITLRQGARPTKILYIGDMGARGNDLYDDAVTNDAYDHLILPAFAAARQDTGQVERQLADIINQTNEAGGNILIPVSSVDRRNAVLQAIRNVWDREQMPSIFAFLDSPVASKQCEAFPLETDGSQNYLCLRPLDTTADSKELNAIRGTVIIIAGSGRGGYGRIGFHLRKNLARPETALVLFGRQADSLLGQSLDGRRKTLSIQGQEVEVRARMYRLDDPDVHLDATAVIEWLARAKAKPQTVYITHGTLEAKTQFHNILGGAGIPSVNMPATGQGVSF